MALPLLICLGRLELQDAPTLETQPLLLLCYLASEGPCVRSELADLFWPTQPARALRLKSLSTALSKLRKVNPEIVQLDKDLVTGKVVLDSQLFLDATIQGDYDAALECYKAPFLYGIERDKRLKLGEEIEEWIIERREALQQAMLDVTLSYAKQLARCEYFEQAAELAWRAYTLDRGVSYPSDEEFEWMHDMLLAAKRLAQAREVRVVAEEIYDDAEYFRFSANPQSARNRLTFSQNIPMSSSTFVGRKEELLLLETWLLRDRARLITVTGLAGVGKTEITAVLIRKLRHAFRDGVYFVPCDTSQITSAIALMRHISNLVGIRNETSQPLAQLCGFFGTKVSLLILDNLDQLVPMTTWLNQLLDACPKLQLLVTSRERLNLKDERLLHLSGLPWHSTDSEGALALFCQRASLVGYDITTKEYADSLWLMEKLEGHPLAITLLASWLTTLSVRQLRSTLEKNPSFFETGLLADTARHQNLEAIIATSVTLLPSQAQDTLIKTALFTAPFTAQAAAALCGAGISTLRLLVDRSLLIHDSETDHYRLHALLRSYALKRLSQRADLSTLRDIHARYFLGQLEQMAADQDKAQTARRLEPIASDLFTAWDWAVSQNWSETIDAAALALLLFVNVSGQSQEAQTCFQKALTHLSNAAALTRAKLLVNLAWCELRQCAYDQTRQHAQEGFNLLADSHDSVTRSNALVALAIAYDEQGYFRKAWDYHEQNIQLHKAQEMNYANALTNAVSNRMQVGDYAQASQFLTATQEIFERHSAEANFIWVKQLWGQLYHETRQLFKARAILRSSLQQAERLGLSYRRLVSTDKLAMVVLELDEPSEARALSEQLLSQARALGQPWYEIRALTTLSKITFKSEQFDKAEALLYMSLSKVQHTGSIPGILYRLILVLQLDLHQGALTRAIRLCGFLQQPAIQERISFVDRALLAKLKIQLFNPTIDETLLTDWQNLTPEEVCTLVLEDYQQKEPSEAIPLMVLDNHSHSTTG